MNDPLLQRFVVYKIYNRTLSILPDRLTGSRDHLTVTRSLNRFFKVIVDWRSMSSVRLNGLEIR